MRPGGRRERARAVPILALALGHVFSNAVRTLPAMAADVLQRDLGLSAEGLGALTGAFPPPSRWPCCRWAWRSTATA